MCTVTEYPNTQRKDDVYISLCKEKHGTRQKQAKPFLPIKGNTSEKTTRSKKISGLYVNVKMSPELDPSPSLILEVLPGQITTVGGNLIYRTLKER